MTNNYFETESTGSKDYFNNKEKDTNKSPEEKTIEDVVVFTDEYKKVEVTVETVQYEIKD